MQEAQLLSGKEIKQKIVADVKARVEAFKKKGGVIPKLVALKIGEDPAADLYFKAQKKLCEEAGVTHEVRTLAGNVSTASVIAEVKKLNAAHEITGVMIQMPLPKQLDAEQVLAALDPAKDVEGVHPHSLGLLMMNKGRLLPCTAAASVELIKASGADLYGKEVVVVGASVQVGKPLAILLLDQMATVTMCRSSASKAGTLESHVHRADVLVAALGQPRAISGAWIKKGAVVIDVGINQVNGKTVGDVDFETARQQAAWITPVPGGVGPVTTAILLRNVIAAAELQAK